MSKFRRKYLPAKSCKQKRNAKMEPGHIKKLDESVVNKIAAGEIIQRPANAIKELLENSLDAKSSYIQITVKSGGLKLLQIQDNGTGIRKEDLEIVCERHTTSKLEAFEDLSSIATFGFRGEALASISYVARLSIQTKTVKDVCAYKASYEDGKLVAAPKPCAGNQGTIITVEDLFYNVPQRKQVLKSPNDEFQRVSDVVNKYAVHNSKVGFILKKFGESQTMKTLPNSSQVDNIKLIYGKSISNELIEVALKDDLHQFAMNGYVTDVNFSTKKGIMLLFINHRLVESASLKSAIDSVYSTHLPKGSYPFVYMSLELEPTIVDVNVHPTKHEVHFLHEDEIIEKIRSHIEMKLLGSKTARTFYKQTRLPGEFDETKIKEEANNSKVIRQNELIRTDAKEQRLEKFFSSNDLKEIFTAKDSFVADKMDKTINVNKKRTELTSILNMRKKVENACSSSLRNVLKEMVFVGVVDGVYALVQQETKLFLTHTKTLSEKLFYQLLLYNFENFKVLTFETPLEIKELAFIALNSAESGWCEDDGPKEELAEKIVEILVDKSEMMKKYFGLTVSEDGKLETLPMLLENFRPPMCRLPLYILRLSTEVEWDDEEECFRSFFQETADYYAYVPATEEGSKKHKWIVEHVIYSGLKNCLIPDCNLKSCFVELTNLPTLYKVFERC